MRRPGFLYRVEVAIILFAGLVVIFALPYQNPRAAGAALLIIVAILLGSAIASFEFSKLLLDGVYPALSSALVFGVMLSENLRVAEAGRRRLAAELQHEREREARTDGELNAARSIQIGLLPRHFPGPPDRSDVDVFASIEPARMVGGDLYDFVLLDSGAAFVRNRRRVGQRSAGRVVHGDDQRGAAHGDAALPQRARSRVHRGERQRFPPRARSSPKAART